jgi:arabinogalactan oligomer/maltooligosaccharide transport system permease protein
MSAVKSTTSLSEKGPVEVKQPLGRRRSFFYGGREDSQFKRLLIHLTLILACFIAAYPILRVVSVSIRPGDRLLSTDLSLIPPDANLEAYTTVLFQKEFLQWIWNSLVITIATAMVGVTLAATSAYAFSRWNFPGRSVGLIFLLSTQMIPAAMLMVPLYILAIRLSLVGTYRGLVIAYSVTAVPFSIWILKGYYDTIPIELEEACRIDGASQLTAFLRILLPLSTPALAIVFLFNFTTAWNDYLLARVILGSQEQLLTWPLGLQRMQGQFQTQWGQFSAASIMVMIPTMILFLLSSKFLISGLTLGSVKG